MSSDFSFWSNLKNQPTLDLYKQGVISYDEALKECVALDGLAAKICGKSGTGDTHWVEC